MEISVLNLTSDCQIQAENKGPTAAMSMVCCAYTTQGFLQIKAKLLHFMDTLTLVCWLQTKILIFLFKTFFPRRNSLFRLPQLKEENPILRPVNIYILSCTVNLFHSLFQLLICSMLLQPVLFHASPCSSYKHYCHLPSINPLCIRQEHWASSEKKASLSQDLIPRGTMLKDTKVWIYILCFFPSYYSTRLHHMSTPYGPSEYATLYLC